MIKFFIFIPEIFSSALDTSLRGCW